VIATRPGHSLRIPQRKPSTDKQIGTERTAPASRAEGWKSILYATTKAGNAESRSQDLLKTE
jgi:hypothetical protein